MMGCLLTVMAFVLGTSFYALGGGENTMQHNFSYFNPD
jgi:hypothetical protein